MIDESLNGSGEQMVVLQGALYNNGADLHIQGKGYNINRDYGVAVTFPISKGLSKWIGSDVDHPHSSMAGTGRKYVSVLATVNYDEGVVHFQVEGNYQCNRDYGAAFQVSVDEIPELADFIDEELVNPTSGEIEFNELDAQNIQCGCDCCKKGNDDDDYYLVDEEEDNDEW